MLVSARQSKAVNRHSQLYLEAVEYQHHTRHTHMQRMLRQRSPNCPENPDRAPAEDTKIMIASGEDDAADEDVYDSAAFIITDTTKTT